MNCINKIKGIWSLLWQFALFVVIAIAIIKLPFKNVLNTISTPVGTINLSNLKQNWNLINGIILFFCEWKYYDFITKKNNEKIIFDKGDYYRDFPYIFYWLGSNFLKYKYCNLVNIPIYLQFKLVLNHVFPIFLTGTSTNESDNSKNYTNDLSEPIILKKNENLFDSCKSVNLILIDTYDISDTLLPSNISSKYTIYIYRSDTINGIRMYNEKFIEVIQQEIVKLNPQINTINIYATTNPKHNKKIADKCFRVGGRTNISHINVAIQEKGTWKFNELKSIK